MQVASKLESSLGMTFQDTNVCLPELLRLYKQQRQHSLDSSTSGQEYNGMTFQDQTSDMNASKEETPWQRSSVDSLDVDEIIGSQGNTDLSEKMMEKFYHMGAAVATARAQMQREGEDQLLDILSQPPVVQERYCVSGFGNQ